MAKKYFVWSFDDGLEQDKQIIEILKKYEMGATFHLNSGLFGKQNMIGRLGNIGVVEKSLQTFNRKSKHLLPFVQQFRIPEDEVRQVYEGFEVASHTAHHLNALTTSEKQLRKDIQMDKEQLSKIFHNDITGFAYPYGIRSQKAEAILRDTGFSYARTIRRAKNFDFPKNPFRLPMTAWHLSSNALTDLEAFFTLESEQDSFFLMFAHGYEFDFNTKESNWTKFESICDRVKQHDEIVTCSIKEALALEK